MSPKIVGTANSRRHIPTQIEPIDRGHQPQGTPTWEVIERLLRALIPPPPTAAPAGETARPTPPDPPDHGDPHSARTAHGRGPRARAGARRSGTGRKVRGMAPWSATPRPGAETAVPTLDRDLVQDRIGRGSPRFAASTRRMTSDSSARRSTPRRSPTPGSASELLITLGSRPRFSKQSVEFSRSRIVATGLSSLRAIASHRAVDPGARAVNQLWRGIRYGTAMIVPSRSWSAGGVVSPSAYAALLRSPREATVSDGGGAPWAARRFAV